MPLKGSSSRAMRLRLRTLTIAVAVAGIAMGLAAHIQDLVRRHDDFALPVLVGEGTAVLVILVCATAFGYVVRMIWKDNAYASRLRRNDVPAQVPLIPTPTDSTEQDGA
jgi:hypothetical protein